MTVRVMYDIGAFRSQNQSQNRLVPHPRAREDILPYASIAFLEELSAQLKSGQLTCSHYERIRANYIAATCGRMTRPWNELIKCEVEAGRPLALDEVALTKDEYLQAMSLFADYKIMGPVADQVKSLKRDYEIDRC